MGVWEMGEDGGGGGAGKSSVTAGHKTHNENRSFFTCFCDFDTVELQRVKHT